MNKYIKELMQIINENAFSDLFSDDVFDDEFDIMDIKSSKTIYQATLGDVLIPVLGTDKPRGWKKVKVKDDDNNTEILVYKNSYTYGIHKYVQDVIDALKNHNYQEYKNTCVPIATQYHFSNLNDFFKSKNKNLIDYIAKYNRYTLSYKQDITKRYANEYKKLLKYPNIVKNLFLSDASYDLILLSPDNGVIFTLQTSANTMVSFSYYDYWHQAEIKFTGEVSYQNMDKIEKKDILDKNKQINILKSAFNKAHKGRVYFSNSDFNLDSDGYPYAIVYFNWKKEVYKGPKYLQKKNIPYSLYYLISTGHFHLLQKFEKEDDNSTYEITKDSVIIKYYYNINKTDNVPEGMDSCMILELTGYLKDYYEQLYLKKK